MKIDTIFALSSGALPSAIAIVRISGPLARVAVEHLAGQLPSPRLATMRVLRDGEDVLDQGILVWFPGPNTVTGEDVAELHLHGSRAVVDACFAILLRLGLRMAEPGEFTRRALFNGKMDLAAVEGLADLLTAETESQRRDAIRRQRGIIPRKLGSWRTRLTMVAATLEAAIDYDGEEETVGNLEERLADLRNMLDEIDRALAIIPAERLRTGIRVAIVGSPNAGKSTLLNALAGRDAAIVSAIAGTTRDVIECPVAIDGIPFVLVDTAGLRDAVDPIERIGIDRAWDERGIADIRIDLDAAAHDSRTIAITAKSDIVAARPGTLAVSAECGSGMRDLQLRLCAIARETLPDHTEIALDRRYRRALLVVRDDLARAAHAPDILLAAEHIRVAIRELDRVLGGDGVEDMLDALFGRFCLGK